MGSDYESLLAYNLESAKEILKSKEVDLILLDLGLPDGEGISLVQDLCIEKSLTRIPIIVLSGHSDIETKVNCLKQGADDFISKPFDKNDLLARIDSVLRRGPLRQNRYRFSVSNVVFDLEKQIAIIKSENENINLELTPIEFKIMHILSKNIGVEVAREALKDQVWGDTFISARNIDTHICKLRKKMSKAHFEISNKRGKGYYLIIHDKIDNKIDETHDVKEQVQIYQKPLNTEDLPILSGSNFVFSQNAFKVK